MRQLSFAKPSHILFCYLVTIIQFYPDCQLLTHSVIRNTKSLGLHYSIVCVQELLHLPGVDVLPTPDDHVLHPPHYLSVPLLVNDCCIPCVEPPVYPNNFILETMSSVMLETKDTPVVLTVKTRRNSSATRTPSRLARTSWTPST